MAQELVAATMKRLRETEPKAAHTALRATIKTMAASLPADKRQKFLEELLARWVLRLDLVIDERVEQELFAHVLEEVFLSPPVEHTIRDLDVAQVP
jgi:uncharacterized protein (DUF2267 family)